MLYIYIIFCVGFFLILYRLYTLFRYFICSSYVEFICAIYDYMTRITVNDIIIYCAKNAHMFMEVVYAVAIMSDILCLCATIS